MRSMKVVVKGWIQLCKSAWYSNVEGQEKLLKWFAKKRRVRA